MAWENGELITAVKLNNMEDQIEENNMSYEKHTWETGELITADKLNHMEEGIEGGGGGYMGLKGISIPVTYVFPEDASYTAADITNVSMRSCIFIGESQIEFNDTPVGDFSNWDLPFIEENTTSLFVDAVYVDDTGFMLKTSNCTYTGDIAYDENTRLINISGNGTMQLVLDWID